MEVVKNSLKLVSVRSRSNWNSERLVFGERGKPEHLEKNLSAEAENQQQTYPFIYLRHEKGAAFGRSHPIKVIIGSTPLPPPLGVRKASALTSAPLFLSFRQKPIHLLYLFYLLYLDKNICSFMSISLIYNKYFATFVVLFIF